MTAENHVNLFVFNKMVGAIGFEPVGKQTINNIQTKARLANPSTAYRTSKLIADYSQNFSPLVHGVYISRFPHTQPALSYGRRNDALTARDP